MGVLVHSTGSESMTMQSELCRAALDTDQEQIGWYKNNGEGQGKVCCDCGYMRMDFVPAPMGTDAILTVHLYLEIRATFSFSAANLAVTLETSFFHTFRRPTQHVSPTSLGIFDT
jgi:hypothetical protein